MSSPDDGKRKPGMSEGTIMRQLAPYLSLGTQLAATILLLGGAGWYADKYFGTTPWMLVGGLSMGSVVGMMQFLRSVSKFSERDKDRR